MKKSEMTKILIEGRRDLSKQMADAIETKHRVFIERAPEKGLIMIRSKDSVTQQPFYAGELLVTECTVSIENVMGLGLLKGEDEERAYQLAVIDAAWNANLLYLDEWAPALEEEKRMIDQNVREEAMIAARSKVNFDTMEDYNDKSE